MGENIIPTRMELMKVKNRIKLASRGHSLLKRKRDALIMELFQVLKKAKDMRKELNEALEEAFNYLYYATMNHTEAEIEAFASSTSLSYELKIDTKNVMGVKVPKLSFKKKSLRKASHLSPVVEYVAKTYVNLIPIILQVGEIEMTVKRLLREVEKTKRRVNALEYVLLPSLEEQKKFISQKLEELERDSFVSLKSIKTHLEKAEKQQSI